MRWTYHSNEEYDAEYTFKSELNRVESPKTVDSCEVEGTSKVQDDKTAN